MSSPHSDTADDGGSHKIAVFITFDLYVPAIEQQFGALIHPTLDEPVYPVFGLRGNEGSNICPRLVTWYQRGTQKNRFRPCSHVQASLLHYFFAPIGLLCLDCSNLLLLAAADTLLTLVDEP